MLEREPFLQAIFAAPGDDMPRLVFADWLDEHGDPAWAELIRVGCRRSQLPKDDILGLGQLLARQFNLLRERRLANGGHDRGAGYDRGFDYPQELGVHVDILSDPDALRLMATRDHPNWYGAVRLKVTGGPVVVPKPLVTILTSPVTANVAELDLSGYEVEVPPAADDDLAREFGLTDFTRHPAINTLMVEELAGMRECRRLTALDLRNNDLGNDALRALAESPYFTRLTKLRLFDGNRFKGRPWQRVLERFGEDVVE